ncbi:FAD-dependent oxidoreductase [Bacillus testis]|uniref:FAD-dependent oxidoreductase n=1 Tax=Bacillus testis TaxID=1622072 RepID=UPI00067E9EBE|nr:FAD-dependent oxidoreductase [Bacillus testis]
MDTIQYDAIVIGFGEAGKSIVADLANRGNTVAMIEQSKGSYGGKCINIGCIPSKNLIQEASQIKKCQLKNYRQKAKAYRQAIEKKRQWESALRNEHVHTLADRENVTVYNGVGSFVSDSVIAVNDGDDEWRLTGTHIFINTGFVADNEPPIKGLHESKHVFNSTSIMNLKQLPRRIAIIGAGSVGLEFASMYANFGSKVMVFDSLNTFMPMEDRDMADTVKEVMERQGIDFHLGTIVEKMKDVERGSIIYYKDQTGHPQEMITEVILIAPGRTLNTKELQSTDIQQNENGSFTVDGHLQSSFPNVYAIGNAGRGSRFMHASLDDYRIVMDDLEVQRNKTTKEQEIVPYSLFFDPPFSRVGLTEKEAKEQGYSYKAILIPVSYIQKAEWLEVTEGKLKVIVDEMSGLILGCALFCAESQELINLIHQAMKSNQSYEVLRDQIFTNEIMSEAVHDLFKTVKDLKNETI